MLSNSTPAKARPLRPGDVVEVRSAAEILATLDGKRFTVSRRVDKICDTITYTGSRRMHSTVYLEDLRCDGSGHDGCQAGCKIYWKEAWLRRVGDGGVVARETNGEAAARLDQVAKVGARTVRELEGVQTEVWRCQATEAVTASEHLSGYDLGQYWRELTNGNYGLFHFVRLMTRAFVMQVAHRLGLLKRMPLRGPGGQTKQERLWLKPGELVQVRSPSEILPTLDATGTNRGLSFDREMLPFCGDTFRVKDVVQKIVDDKTGRMLKFRKDCIILDGTVCSGERSLSCWFCPRKIHSYWREAWLKRVDDKI
jgi:hypothetical protein